MPTYTNHHGLPEPLARTVVRLAEAYSGPKLEDIRDRRRISVTTLLNPPMITLLRMQHADELVQDVADLLYLTDGVAFHSLMEETVRQGLCPGWHAEVREETTFSGWTISGQADIFSDDVLSDYKYTSVYAVRGDRVGDWAAQANVNRWIRAREGHTVPPVLETWARLRDWGPRHERELPIPFKSITVPVWTDQQTEDFVAGRLRAYDAALDGAALVCAPAERWNDKRCARYCDVARYCPFGAALLGVAE